VLLNLFEALTHRIVTAAFLERLIATQEKKSTGRSCPK
jgi:hypothetical protein